MILTKKFWLRFVIYLIVVSFIHLILFVILGGIGMADDISTETRMSYAAIPSFIINKVFGFPLNLFIHYDPINETSFGIGIIVIYILNCLVQFSILSVLWKFIQRR